MLSIFFKKSPTKQILPVKNVRFESEYLQEVNKNAYTSQRNIFTACLRRCKAHKGVDRQRPTHTRTHSFFDDVYGDYIATHWQ